MEGSANIFIFTGIVVVPPKFQETTQKRLRTQVRIKLVSNRYNMTRFAYVEVTGYGEMAKALNLCCELGNSVYCEAHLINRFKYERDESGVVRTKAIYEFVADVIKRVGVPTERKEMPDEKLVDVIRHLDPITYLNEEELAKGKTKK